VTVLTVEPASAGARLDRWLSERLTDLSRARLQSLIRGGLVRVDGAASKAAHRLRGGERVEIEVPPPADETLTPESVPLSIVYEDPHVLVVDKPAGMVVHPGAGRSGGTLAAAILAHAPTTAGVGGPRRPGIVHRLDKDTSGLLVVAKDPATHAALAQQMKDRAMVKRYLTLVEGAMPTAEGVIDAPIGRDPRQRLRMGLLSVASGGREARTRFRTLEEHGGRSLLEVQLETGRTHQIRVHLAAVHHPVVGDPIYGRAQRPLPPRQFLHAAHLEFRHPSTGEWLTFDAPLPDDLASFLASWRAEGAR
jgi:23S rRNA pseudouridine1911/1915/1917 synthase